MAAPINHRTRRNTVKTESTPRIQHGPGELVSWLLPSLLLVLSAIPALGQDPFTKITTGPVVTDVGDSTGGAWGDYDDDGLPDLFVSRGTVNMRGESRVLNLLYHNEGNGAFMKVTNGPVMTDRGWFRGGTWGDYDGDGDLDLFVGNATIPGPGVVNVNILYRNLGGGAFEKITSGPLVTGLVVTWTAAWVDFNRDSLLDLFVVSAALDPGGIPINTPNTLFQNQGNDTFDLVSKPPLTTEIRTCERAAWSDYDNDGRPDVAATSDFLGFYHQETDGSFVLAKVQPESHWFSGLAWGDYDNDGLVDLYQGRFFEDTVSLYHNLGGGQFEELRLPGGPNNQAGAWGDYDNDGYLDLFVTEATGQAGKRNQLYRNNRDGTFTQLASGESVVTDPVRSPSTWSFGCSWADHDNDGFLDLFVANGENTSQRNFLYHNNGNTNHWLLLRLKGTVSNRSAIGARVRARATIWGKEVSQMRDVGGGADWSQGDLRPHFGLGDATTVTTLRLEWPSGLVQEFADLPANQILTVEEGRPILMKPELRPDGTFQFQLNGGVIGQSYVTESSADLADWTAVSTNAGPTALVAIPPAPGSVGSFVRVKQQ